MRLATAALVAASLAAARPALAAPDRDSIVRVDVSGPDGFSGFGSGVIVRGDPPTVLTCAHVIAGRSSISVYLPSVDSNVRVVKVMPIFHHDVAFLRLDESEFSSLESFTIPKLHFAPPSGSSATAPMTLIGWDAGDHSSTRKGQFIGPVRNLADLPIGPKPQGAIAFDVVELEDDNGNGSIVLHGDSGAPLFAKDSDQVAALAAGFVGSTVGGTRVKPFAVLIVDPVPDASAINQDPGVTPSAQDPDPYAGLLANQAVSQAMFDFSLSKLTASLTADLRPCGQIIATRLARYEGRSDELKPLSMPGLSSGCRTLDEQARDMAVRRDRVMLKARLQGAVEQASPGKFDAPALDADAMLWKEAQIDGTVRRRAGNSPDLKSRVAPILKLTPKGASKSADEGQRPSTQYAQLAKQLQLQLDTLMRTGKPAGSKPAR